MSCKKMSCKYAPCERPLYKGNVCYQHYTPPKDNSPKNKFFDVVHYTKANADDGI